MRPCRLLAVMSLVLLGFAPAPFPRTERARDESNDFTGFWSLEACDTNGRRDPGDAGEYQVETTRERLAFQHRRGNRTAYDLWFDPAASPPAFTWSQRGQVMFVGSYRLRKGQLTLIFTSGTRLADRPTDFEGKPTFRYVLRRIKRA